MSKSSLKSFGVNATTRLYRTKFKHHDTCDLTFAPGWLVPVYCREVIPSDVWNMKEVDISVKQALESAKPTFGDVYLSVYYFFVPYRILWEKFTEIYGKGQPSEWDNPTETVLPRCAYMAEMSATSFTLKPTTGGGYDACVKSSVLSGTSNPPVIVSDRYNLADYLNFAWTEVDASDNYIDINWMRFAAYAKIWTEWFRDQNVQNSDPDVEKFYHYSGSGTLDVRCCLHYANKLKDVFTTCLPSPQKGDPVTVALGDVAPIIIGNDDGVSLNINTAQQFEVASSGVVSPNSRGSTYAVATTGIGTYAGSAHLYADLSNAVGATVNQVRFDFAMQKMKERDARGGTRFPEVMLSTFEAYNGDSAMQRPELLGGDTVQLNMTTVPSTGSNPGKLGGMSNTNVSTRPFVKTFGEPGLIMAVATIRPRNMYKQGIPKDSLKYRRYHWYDPCLQNVGDQPVMKCEIDAKAGGTAVFGFQEAWYEYKSDVNVVAGDMRGGTTDMDAWSYANEFTTLPYLNSDFKKQDGSAITKTLVGYNGTNYPGYVYTAHFDFRPEVTSPMMPHSIPGLIDHII